MSTPSILAIFAHPDDEVFCGGALARAVGRGWRITLACATGGEAGEISEPHLATRETIGAVRAAELRACADALGIADLRMVGYRDSGMVGTPENADPRCLHQADPAEALRRFTALIRDVQPDLVLTHDPTGGYGHPDHIAVCTHVTAAFSAAADADFAPELGPAWRAAQLSYGVMSKSFFARMGEMMRAAGVDTSSFERPEFLLLGYEDDAITTSLDVTDQLAVKWAGLEAHSTQFGPQSPMRQIPEQLRGALFGHEHFVLASPAGAADMLAALHPAP